MKTPDIEKIIEPYLDKYDWFKFKFSDSKGLVNTDRIAQIIKELVSIIGLTDPATEEDDFFKEIADTQFLIELQNQSNLKFIEKVENTNGELYFPTNLISWVIKLHNHINALKENHENDKLNISPDELLKLLKKVQTNYQENDSTDEVMQDKYRIFYDQVSNLFPVLQKNETSPIQNISTDSTVKSISKEENAAETGLNIENSDTKKESEIISEELQPSVISATTQESNAFQIDQIKTEINKIKKWSNNEGNNLDYQNFIEWINNNLFNDSFPIASKNKIQNFLSFFDLGHDKTLQPIVEYNRWREYIEILLSNYEDELIFPLIECLEAGQEYGIYKSKEVLCFPIDKNILKKEEDIKGIKEVLQTKVVEDISNPKIGLAAIPKSYLRGAEELDIYFYDANEIVNNNLNSDLKNKLRSILIAIKGITGNGRKKLVHLSTDASNISSKFQFNKYKLMCLGILDILESSELYNKHSSSKPQNIEQYLGELDFKSFNELKECPRKLKNKFIDFLKKHILKTFAQLTQSKILHKEEIIKREYTEEEILYLKKCNWNKLFDQLIDVFVCFEEENGIIPNEKGFINKYLHIRPINAKRGDLYNHILHQPYTEGESDEKLEDDQIKELDSDGFVLMGNNYAHESYDKIQRLKIEEILQKELPQAFIVQQAKVVIVKN